MTKIFTKLLLIILGLFIYNSNLARENGQKRNVIKTDTSDSTTSPVTGVLLYEYDKFSGVSPTGIARDILGNIYISDYGLGNIYKYSPGSTTGVSIGKRFASSICVDKNLNVYTTNFVGSGGIYKIAPGSSSSVLVYNLSEELGSSEITPSICIDKLDNIYMTAGNKIVKFNSENPQGITIINDSSIVHARSVFVDEDFNIYVKDSGAKKLLRFSSNGTIKEEVGRFSWNSGKCLAVDSIGNIYIDNDVNNIVRFTPGNLTGTIVAGRSNPGSLLSQLDNPWGILIDGKNILITDNSNYRVVSWDVSNPNQQTGGINQFSATLTGKVNCDGTGKLDLNISGGFPPYTYSVSESLDYEGENFGPFLSDTVLTIKQNQIPVRARYYKVKVKDSMQEEILASVDEYGNSQLDFSVYPLVPPIIRTIVHPSTLGSTDGQIEIQNPEGGNILVNDQYYGSSINNLSAGTYKIKIENFNSCFSSVKTVILTDPLIIKLMTKANPSNPEGNNGSIKVFATGGTGQGYHFFINGISNGSSGDFNNLTDGTYIITVKDDSLRTSNNLKVVLGGAPLSASINGVNGACDELGSIEVTSSGGNGEYIAYYLNDSEISNAFEGTKLTIRNLQPGNYHIKVVDGEGNISEYTNEIAIASSKRPTLKLDINHLNFSGSNDGAVKVNILGRSSSGYKYYLSTTSGTISNQQYDSPIISNLPHGSYTIFVNNQDNCASSSYPFKIYDPSVKEQPIIGFSSLSNRNLQDGNFDLSISSNINEFPIRVTSSDSSIVSISKGEASWIANAHKSGKVNITASQQANDYILGASITHPITIRGEAVINFPEMPSKTFADLKFDLNANSNNNETPLYFESSDPSIISLENTSSGWVAIINKAGSAVISAVQNESESFTYSRVEREIVINSAQRKSVIKFTALSRIIKGEGNQEPDLFYIGHLGDLSSNNKETEIMLTSSDPSIGSLEKHWDAWYVRALNPGAINITATQPGNENYLAADSLVRILVIKPKLERIPIAAVTPSEETGLSYIPFYHGIDFEKTNGVAGDPNLKYVDVSFKLTRKTDLARIILYDLPGGTNYPLSLYAMVDGKKKLLNGFDGTSKRDGSYYFDIDSTIITDEIIVHKYGNNMPSIITVHGSVTPDSHFTPIKSEIKFNVPDEIASNNSPVKLLSYYGSYTTTSNHHTPVIISSSDSTILEVVYNNDEDSWIGIPKSEGVVTITANQAGTDEYAPGATSKSITIKPADNRLEPELSPLSFGPTLRDSTFTILAQSSNTETPLHLESSNPSVLKVLFDKGTWKGKVVGEGRDIYIYIKQEGNEHYKPGNKSHFCGYISPDKVWGYMLPISSIIPAENTGMDYFNWWFSDDIDGRYIQNTTGSNDANQKWTDITFNLERKSKITKVALLDVEGEFPNFPVKVYALNGTDKKLLGEFKGQLTNQYFDIVADTSIVADAIVIHKFGNFIPQAVQIYGVIEPDTEWKKTVTELRLDMPDTIFIGKIQGIPYRYNVSGPPEWISSDPSVISVAGAAATGLRAGQAIITVNHGETYSKIAASVSKTVTVVPWPSHNNPIEQRIAIAKILNPDDGLNYYPWWFDDTEYLINTAGAKKQYDDVILKLTNKSKFTRISLFDDFGEFQDYPVTIYAVKDNQRQFLGEFKGLLNHSFVDIKLDTSIIADEIVIRKYGSYIPQKVQIFGFPVSEEITKISSEYESFPTTFPQLYSKQQSVFYTETSTNYNNKQTELQITSSDPSIFQIIRSGLWENGKNRVRWIGIASKPGIVTLTVSQPGNDQYQPGKVLQYAYEVPTWYPTKGMSNIIFDKIPDLQISEDLYPLVTSSTNTEIPVIHTSSDTSVAKVVLYNGKWNIVLRKAGKVSIIANQNGNDNFYPAKAITNTFTVSLAKKSSILTVNEIPELHLNEEPYSLLVASTNNEMPIMLTSSDPSIATVVSENGNWKLISYKIGKVKIIATQQGNDNFTPAHNASVLVKIIPALKQIPVIRFEIPSYKHETDSVFVLSASSSNTEIPILFVSSDEAIVSITNNLGQWFATIHQAGNVNITAHQDSNFRYHEANVIRNLIIKGKALTTIDLPPIEDKALQDYVFYTSLSTNNSEAPVSIQVSDPSILSLTSESPTWKRIVMLKRGTVTITASQPETANYKASSVSRTFSIKDVTQLNFNITAKTNNDTSYELIATSNHAESPIEFSSSHPEVVSVSNSTGKWIATIKRLGSTLITASQGASEHYAAAQVTQSQNIVRNPIPPLGGERLVIASAVGSINTNQDYAPLINDDPNDKVVEIYGYGNPNDRYVDVILALERNAKISRIAFEDTNGALAHPITVYAQKGNSRTLLGTFAGIYGSGEYFDINVDTSVVADAIILNKFGNDLPRKVQAFGYVLQSDSSEAPVAISSSIKFAELLNKTNNDLPFELQATSNNKETEIIFESSNPLVVSVAKANGKWVATIKRVGIVTITAKQSGNQHYLNAVNVSRSFTILRDTVSFLGGQRLIIASATSNINTGQDYTPLITDDPNDLIQEVYSEDNNQYVDVVLNLAKKAKLSRITFADDWTNLDENPVKVYARKGNERTLLGTFDGPYGLGSFYDINVDTSIVADAIILEKHSNYLPRKVLAYGYVLPSDTSSTDVALSARITFSEIGNKTNNDEPFKLLATSNNTETEITFESSNPQIVSVAKLGGKWMATIKRLGAVTITAKQEGNENFTKSVPVSKNINITRALLAPDGGERLIIASATGIPATGQDYAPLINDNPNDLVQSVWTDENKKYVDVKLTLKHKARISRVTFIDDWGDLSENPVKVYAQKGLDKTFLGVFDGTYGQGDYFDINVDTSIIADAIILQKHANSLPRKIQAFGYVLPLDSNEIPVAVGTSIKFLPLPNKTNNDAPFELIASSNNTDTEITFESSHPENVLVSKINGRWLATIKRIGIVTIKAKQAASANYLAAPDVEQSLAVNRAANPPQGGGQLLFTSAESDINTGQDFTPLINNDLSDRVSDVWGSEINKQYVDVTLTLEKRARISRITIPDDWGDLKQYPVKIFAQKGTIRTLLGTFEGIYGEGDFYDVNVDTSVIADAIIIQKYENSIPREIHVYGYIVPLESFIDFQPLVGKVRGDEPFQLNALSNNKDSEITFNSSDPSIVSVEKIANGWYATIHKEGTVNIIANQAQSANFLAAPIVSRSLTISKEIVFVLQGEDPSCHEEKGKITITAIGGAGNYTYSLNGSAYQTSPQFLGLSSGIYKVKVKDGSGLESRTLDSIKITVPDALVLSIALKKNPTLFQGSDGQIQLSTNGGNGPISFIVNGVERNTSTTIDSLISGLYVITAKDTSGCSTTLTTELTEPPMLSLTTQSVSASCNQKRDGSITIIATGGVPPYEYAIHPVYIDSVIAFQNINVFNNVTTGEYIAYVRDSFGGIKHVSGKVSQPEPVKAEIKVVNPVCSTEKGYISINAKGGSGKYLYSLNNDGFKTDPLYRNLDSGLYVVRVKDSNDCFDIETQTVEITRPNSVELIIRGQKLLNSNVYSNGSLQVNAKGGSGFGYTYFIKEDDDEFKEVSTTYFNTLGTGNYTIYAVDSRFCPSDSFNISLINIQKLNVSVSHTNESCFTTDDGSINIAVTGGSAPYYYSIDSGKTYSSNSVFNNLKASTYGIRIKDAANLTDTASIIITQPSEILSVVTLENTVNASKLIRVNVTGGNKPYSYSINGQAYQSDSTFTNVGYGLHLISVRDSNGCLSTVDSIKIDVDPLKFSHSITWAKPGSNNGTITINASGGVSPYVYGIENIDANSLTDSLIQNVPLFKNLRAGNYSIWVKDEAGTLISVLDSIRIGSSNLAISTNTTNIKCLNAGGEICIQALHGIGPYYYGIEKVGSNLEEDYLYSYNACFSNLKTGIYKSWVKDVTGAIASKVDTIQNDHVLKLRVLKSLDTWQTPDGQTKLVRHIAVRGSGGSGRYLYSLTSEYGTVETGSEPMNIYSTNNAWIIPFDYQRYVITVVDSWGCSESIEVLSDEPTQTVTANVNHVTCTGNEDGSIELEGVNGDFIGTDFSVYINYLNGLPYATTTKFNRLKAGVYTFYVVSSTGWQYSIQYNVNEPKSIDIDNVVITNVSCYNENNGEIHIKAKGGYGGPYNYSWMGYPDWEGKDLVNNLAAGNYTVLITEEATQCAVYKNFTITQPLDITIDHLTDTIMCKSQTINVNAKNEGCTYLWKSLTKGNILSTSQQFAITEPDTYELKVIGPSGCVKSKTFNVTTSVDAYKADFLVSTVVNVGDTVVMVNITKPSPPNSVWSLPFGAREIGSNSTGSIKQLVFDEVGSYTVSMRVTVGTCITSMTKTINVLPNEATKETELALGYKEPTLKKLGLFPNPTSGEFTLNIELSKIENVKARLISYSTNEIIELKEDFGKALYNIPFSHPDLSSGIYFLIVEVGGQVKTLKIIKI